MGCYLVEEIIGLRITPSAKRNTYSVAILFCINTQGRGATRLNPGLGKRNSYRVAGGAYRLRWANNTAVMGRGAARLNPGLGKRNSYRVAGGAYRLRWANNTAVMGRGAARLNPGLGKRNSYRVAGGAYRLRWANNTAVMGRGAARLNPGQGKQQLLQSCRGCVASTMGYSCFCHRLTALCSSG